MSKSGVTRRIDELGRIVIPKEIRYNLGIRDGEPLDILVENNNIIIKKFSKINNIKELSEKVCRIFEDILNISIIISDRDKYIASSRKYYKYLEKDLEEKFKKLIDNREIYQSDKKELFLDNEVYLNVVPIIISSDSNGLVFVITENITGDALNYAKLIQKIIISKLDIT